MGARATTRFHLRGVVSLALVVFTFSANRAAAQQATGTVRGIVRDSTGAVVVGAQVTSAGGKTAVATGDDGRFALAGVRVGAARILVRRLGFRPVTTDADVTAVGDVRVAITLAAIPSVLAAVAVRARREPFESRLSGFNARRTRGIGYFITRQQIDRTASAQLIDALRGIPGVRVVTLRGALGRSVHLGGANCPPLVFLDGFPATAGPFDLDGVELGSLEGVEIYSGGSSVPAELMGPQESDRCGVIALWSAPARPRASSSAQEAVDVDQLVASGIVYTANQVDSVAVYEDGSATVLYPELLAQSHIRGRVVVQVVVGTDGDVEPGTATVVTTTNDGFSLPAVAAALHARFVPATIGGKRVRQVVLLPFEFDPVKLDADSQ